MSMFIEVEGKDMPLILPSPTSPIFYSTISLTNFQQPPNAIEVTPPFALYFIQYK